jgi:XTP/dITP diphosphohydrolase
VRDLLVATGNPHKVREIREILEGSGWAVHSPRGWAEERGLSAAPEVVEDGETFPENAEKKARELCAWGGIVSLADDSGIEIDALGGLPGVRSARFSGVEGPGADAANNEKMVGLLRNVEPERRTARYRCAVALCWPDGRVARAEGTCEGRITLEPRGHGGFGYDPYFLVEGDALERTMAELRAEEKHSISHRGRALRRLLLALDAPPEPE